MTRHIGFEIPLSVTHKQGRRDREPSNGICVECNTRRPFLYRRHDNKPYCSDCIAFDLACASPSDEMKREQKHPPSTPSEMVFERVRAGGGTDDFELRAIVPGPHPDPRMYDKALS